MTIEINTERLYLKLLNKTDLDLLISLDSDPEVRQFFPTGPQNKEQIEKRMYEFIRFYDYKKVPCFVIHTKDSNEFVGRCGFGLLDTGEIEVGYVLMKKFWNKGYASEVLKSLLKWAKSNISADYIIGFAPIDHRASQRVMEKAGLLYYTDAIVHGVTCKYFRINNV